MLISNIFFLQVVFDPTNIQILKQFTTDGNDKITDL